MTSEKFSEEFPIGLGREAEPKETLPAVEVKNEVIWVDKGIEFPLNLKKGEPTKLGLFLTPYPQEEEKTFQLKVQEHHGRSALLGKTIFRDKQGNLYRDINIKGGGDIRYGYQDGQHGLRVSPMETGAPSGRTETGSYGIVNESFALRDIEMSRKFRSFGIRTYRPFALIKLYEIIDKNGKKISIDEAKGRYILEKDEEPVLELRAFGTQNRVKEGMIKKITLEDARRLVAQELEIDEKKFTVEEYLKWFAETLGKDVALMHKNKYYHGYLTDHNITLDCRIVDLDSVGSFFHKDGDEQEKLMSEDFDSAELVVYNLAFFNASTSNISAEEYRNIFAEGYLKAIKKH